MNEKTLDNTTEDLYTTSDVKRVRELLLQEQGNKCAALGIHIKPDRTPVLDHFHNDEQLVRGVLEREVNAFLGVIENANKRYLRYWLPTPLPEVLRGLAGYLERSEATPDRRFRHNGWLKKVKVWFNKLPAKKMDEVLVQLGSTQGKNLADRKAKFAKVVLDRSLGYDTISQVIKSTKEKAE